jgi:predicted Fe-Mo cluster-binding NifX family protein
MQNALFLGPAEVHNALLDTHLAGASKNFLCKNNGLPDSEPLVHLLLSSKLMKIAIPYWQGRISPVFDEATRLVLVETGHGREVRRETQTLTCFDPWERAREIRLLGTQVLICGAISRPLEMALHGAGITVIARICGPVEEVLAAFVNGRLENDAYRMPGCGRRRGSRLRRRQGRWWQGDLRGD